MLETPLVSHPLYCVGSWLSHSHSAKRAMIRDYSN